MTTPDNPEGTDPTRGEDVEHDKQRTDPAGGISAKDPSRQAPDPTAPAAPGGTAGGGGRRRLTGGGLTLSLSPR